MIMNRPDPSVAVRALKSAAPYIRMYKNKVFIIKAGGAVFSDEISTRALIEQVAPSNTVLDYDGDAVRIIGLADGHLDTRKSDTDLTIAVISLGPGARGNFSHGRYIVPDLPRW